MNPRWFVAAPIAAVALFFWSFVSHMVIGLEEKFVRPLPGGEAITAALKENVKAPGLYFYPGEQDMEKLTELTKTTPTGIITFTPPGTPFNFGANLGRQFGLYLICTLLAAWMYSKALPGLHSLPERILFVALIGVIAAILITGGYANWYGMPWGLMAIGIVDQGAGWAIAGFIFAKMIR